MSLCDTNLLRRLDNLETFLMRLPGNALELQEHLDTISQTRWELTNCWDEISASEIEYYNECPKCGGILACRDCNWRT